MSTSGPVATTPPDRNLLLGAILIKARSLMVQADPASEREDLLRLLSLVAEPRELASVARPSPRVALRPSISGGQVRALCGGLPTNAAGSTVDKDQSFVRRPRAR